MRASEVRNGEDYAVYGREHQLARVHVITREHRIGGGGAGLPIRFQCKVVAGEVWRQHIRNRTGPDYAQVGEHVTLTSRDLLRTWGDQQERQHSLQTQRAEIRAVMSEMDAMLVDLGLDDVHVTHVQLEEIPVAVAILGIKEVRTLHARLASSDLGEVEGSTE